MDVPDEASQEKPFGAWGLTHSKTLGYKSLTPRYN